MIRVIQFDALLKLIVFLTIVLSVGLYALLQSLWLPDYPLFKIVTLAMTISTVVVVVLLTSRVSRAIWSAVCKLNPDIFPDLNGTWHGSVTLENGNCIEIRAVIRQTLLYMHIDVHGETMKSMTIETTPAIEQGQKKLYYVYHCTPKNPTHASYSGCTLFDVRRHVGANGHQLELSGRYYTDRKTVGRVRLQQISSSVHGDVSFY